MIHLVVAPIVEGEGDERAIPKLLHRIVQEFCPDTFVTFIPGKVLSASKIVKPDDECLQEAVQLAARKLAQRREPAVRRLILILIDADGQCAAQLGPELKRRAISYASNVEIATVIAVDEYETWFVAAAESLAEFIVVNEQEVPNDPETRGAKKKWIEDRFRGIKYKETVDQPKFSAKMDLNLCRSRSPSFDKLCREIERMAIPGDVVAVI